MGIPTLISTSTADGASAVAITSGIDSTYDEYMFVFTDIGAATNGVDFHFQVNVAGQSGFNETMTTTAIQLYSDEGGGAAVTYQDGFDQAQGTAYQTLSHLNGNGSDESSAGELHLFNPASTTYVKHFYARVNNYYYTNYTMDNFSAGYINTTTAIDDIQFKMSTGNMDAVIKMYGVG